MLGDSYVLRNSLTLTKKWVKDSKLAIPQSISANGQEIEKNIQLVFKSCRLK